jgi:hypothetical protein
VHLAWDVVLIITLLHIVGSLLLDSAKSVAGKGSTFWEFVTD